ncbi:alcohol dehydrogenase, zinc-binding protein (plasmid) [Cupriavidus necator N-1]|uniref:Alcohol dehydrogenase, zinc-binding protein n=1 Tax=Cupriavidus necator (strain ATCC 43291 / DSM 13513 / CCUG 52238 / LMG 8453 / N-1) TaxID=1042878 RepID=F8GU68_CUPNN|nr:NADPH:quinone oxidoreductase family protein [Cupriavidus necator]AEI82272.1 alcohol dehydrogenase, zinc-binding protein [Cupriavidus necator N-1]MDX6007292.1 NADPH:quinone oxidoreductase family protein [Cupriavidus necator]
MKALRVHHYDSSDAIRLDEVAIPEPGDGEVRIRIEASGISFVDMLIARGGYQVRLTPPFVPGSEFSGIVDAIGPSVAPGLKVGDRVCGTGSAVWAQYVCLPASHLHPIPGNASMPEAAVLTVSFGTALYGLRERGELVTEETLLVLGAAGGVGYAAVQVGKALGARVIAVASTAQKRFALLAAGADEVVDGAGDWKDAVKSLSGRSGVDVVFDPVGNDATDAAFRTLGWGGRHLMVGFAGGDVPLLKSNLAIVKGASLVGVDYRQFGERDPGRRFDLEREVLEMWSDGKVKPLVTHTIPLHRFDAALEHAQSRSTVGRVVFTAE